MGIVKILTIILNVIIILITLYLIFLYIKSQNFKVYPCYNIIIISIILFIDNILRLVPTKDFNEIIQYGQAFLLTCLDKLILTTLTAQTFIIYMGVCQTKLYFGYERCIFFITLVISLLISTGISIYFITIGLDFYSTYFYCKGNDTKKIIDTIFNAIFLFLNLVFIILLLVYISKKKRDASLGIIEDLDYGHHHTRMVSMFIINSLLFIESYLIIYDAFPTDEVDLIYLITCLIIDIYYTINKIVIQETLKIFCTSYYEKKYPTVKNDSLTGGDDSDDDDDNNKNERKSSFSDD